MAHTNGSLAICLGGSGTETLMDTRGIIQNCNRKVFKIIHILNKRVIMTRYFEKFVSVPSLECSMQQPAGWLTEL